MINLGANFINSRKSPPREAFLGLILALIVVFWVVGDFVIFPATQYWQNQKTKLNNLLFEVNNAKGLLIQADAIETAFENRIPSKTEVSTEILSQSEYFHLVSDSQKYGVELFSAIPQNKGPGEVGISQMDIEASGQIAKVQSYLNALTSNGIARISTITMWPNSRQRKGESEVRFQASIEIRSLNE